MLKSLILIPIIGGLGLWLIPLKEEEARWWGLLTSLLTFALSLVCWVGFDATRDFQWVDKIEWVGGVGSQPGWEVNLGIDGISLFFVLLTTLLVPLCLLGAEAAPGRASLRWMIGSYLIMEGLILVVFTVLDLVVFYVFFESVLIPMFLIIGVWGSRERRVRAAYFFFLYTLLGSVLMLLGILVIYWESGTTDYQTLVEVLPEILKGSQLQYLLWLAFFASFAVKVPMVPGHIWLPEAHVEAPTGGSVILAGILLKLGTYGLVRFSLPLFPVASVYFTPLVYAMALIGVVYTSMTAMRQTDMKRIIAYASVAHMNLTLIGLFSLTPQGVEGSILQMLSHGLVSGALFLCVGVLYDRHHSRLVIYYSGVAHTMPIYCAVFLFFTMANLALPGTSSFVGEFMILLGTFQVNRFVTLLAGSTMVLGGAYSLWLYNRVAYGNGSLLSSDLTRRELFAFLPLIVLTLVMGVYPEIFLDPLHVSCANLIAHVLGGF